MPQYILGARGHDFGTGNVKEIFTLIKQSGWSCTQLAFKRLVKGVQSYEDVTPELIKKVEKAVREVQLDISVLGTYVELGSMDEVMRRNAVKDFISQIPVCKELNIPCIGSETSEWRRSGATHEEAKKVLLKSLEEIMPVAEEHGVIVALEPVYTHTLNSVETTREILDCVQSSNLKIILDMANLMGPEWIEKQDVLFGRAVESWGELITAVHMKGVFYDNNKRKSCLLEESIVDYASAFRAMKDLPQEIIPVLREEAVPPMAKQEQDFMKKVIIKNEAIA